MLDQIWPFIAEQLKSNNFLSGGAVLMVLGWLAHTSRSLPIKVGGWIRDRFVVELDVPDRSEAFQWIDKWLSQHSYTKNRARDLTVTTKRNEDDRNNAQPQIILTPAPGRHFLFWRRRLIILRRTREEKADEGKGGGGLVSSLMPKETFAIRILTRNRNLARELVEEARELSCPQQDHKVSIYYGRYGSWNRGQRRVPRPIESVVLEGSIMSELTETIKWFLENPEWYYKRGIPYRLGILLDGPPGSGKSSTVYAQASNLKMDVACVNLSARTSDDENLQTLMMDLPKHTFLLIEDVDCAWNQREKNDDDQSYVTFSGLLNAIDGVGAAEGRVLWMTTNHIDKLDAALIRPGRVDLQKTIGYASHGQICRIFERFFPEATPSQTLRFVDHFRPDSVSMATLQGHLTKYSDDAEAAVLNATEIAA